MHQVEANPKRIEYASIMFTLVLGIRGQCASNVLMVTQLLRVTKCLVLHVPVMYQYMVYYYYVIVLHLSGYSVNGHFSIRVRVRVRVWYYFIFRDQYMK